jgi:hypothetical protein
MSIAEVVRPKEFALLPETKSENWNGGQKITLSAGQTAKCTTLIPGQIYAALFYNAAQNQQNTTVQVALGNKHVKPVVVPGTTANQGLAAVALFTGSDSTVVSASVLVGVGTPKIEAWLGSVSMPTDTSGIDNKPLPPDGQFHEFGKAVRYFAVPPSRNCFVTIRSQINQFISVQFREDHVQVNLVNSGENTLKNIALVGTIEQRSYSILSTDQTFVQYRIFGDGSQWVWMPVDSQQNSKCAEISLQCL